MAFHLLGLKCSSCGSYNTRRMGLHTADGSPLEAAGRLGIPAAAGAGGANGAGPLAGLAPNLAQNLLEVRPACPGLLPRCCKPRQGSAWASMRLCSAAGTARGLIFPCLVPWGQTAARVAWWPRACAFRRLQVT